MKWIEYGDACDACVLAIANDDYTGMSDEQEEATRSGLLTIGEWLTVTEDAGFSNSRCEVCGGLAGNRHKVGYLK